MSLSSGSHCLCLHVLIQPQDEEQWQVPWQGMLMELTSNGFVLCSLQGWAVVVLGGGEEATSIPLTASLD